jgi:hypothetical protein
VILLGDKKVCEKEKEKERREERREEEGKLDRDP